MKNKREKIYRTISKIPETKIWNEEYIDAFSGERYFLPKEEIIQRIKKVLWEIKAHPEYLTVEEAILEAGIPQSSYYYWVKKFAECAHYNATALTLLGVRREKYMSCIKYGYRDQPLMRKHGYYDTIWREESTRLNNEKATAMKAAGIGGGTIVVEMDRQAPTAEVDAKLKKDGRERKK